MGKSAGKIQCSNNGCKTFNEQKNQVCCKCGTPIVKRYLRGIGGQIKGYSVGELIGDRYLLKSEGVVLDTLPRETPHILEKIPKEIMPYLKLFPYRLHIPQVYGLLSEKSEIWLLEYGILPTEETGELKYAELLPRLTEEWSEAKALRQLNWLWQIAKLWQPLKNKKVASSLLNPSLLRVNGSIIQLLELERDKEQLSLKQLGELWSEWKPVLPLEEFLTKLCQQLQQGRINEPEKLIEIIELGMQKWGKWQERNYEIYTLTDAGKVREHNEDACYPSPGKKINTSISKEALAIVCDGLGGQEGGEIASLLAINSLSDQVKNWAFNSNNWNGQTYIQELKKAIGIANNLISDRNDSENRHERERMGTTLVMTLPHEHEIYLSHVGDSRIYLITATGCYQITLDDDLASREVRLGYSVYRDVLQYPNSGALVQALGMNSSATLHTNVQRWVLDEDCVFLLCSDGLSDYDRVEQYWETEILPIVKQETTVEKAAARLIEIANEKNGHDNITVGLVYCQVKPKEVGDNILSWSELQSYMPTLADSDAASPEITQIPTQAVSQPEESNASFNWGLLAIPVLLLILAGSFYFLFSDKIKSLMSKLSPNDDAITDVYPTPQTNIPEEKMPTPSPSPSPAQESNNLLEITQPLELEINGKIEAIPVGSILQKVVPDDDQSPLKYKICKIAQGTDSLNLEGKTGKIKNNESEISEKTKKFDKKNENKAELGQCGKGNFESIE